MPISKKTFLSVTLVFMPLSVFAAIELDEEQANKLQPFKEINVRGAFYTNTDYVDAISKVADKEGANSFYITTTNISPSNDTLRIVYAKLYKDNAPEVTPKNENFRQIKGVYEYSKENAYRLEPFDIIRMRDYYATSIEMNNAIAQEASKHHAYAFYIDNIQEMGSNQIVTAYLYKKDAIERKLQPENAIPYDSEAGKQALAQGGAIAQQVEKSGYYSPSSFNENLVVLKDDSKIQNKSIEAPINTSKTVVTSTDNSTSIDKPIVAAPQAVKRYTVTLPDGRKIQELNNATAAKMVAYETIKFRGYFVTSQEISYQAGKNAIEKGAKYYHISRISQDSKGPNSTVYVDLYR